MSKNKHINFQLAKFTLYIYLGIALLAPFISGDKPLIAITNGEWNFPVLKHYFTDQTKLLAQDDYSGSTFLVMPIIPYSSKTIDSKNQGNIGPFDNQNIESLKYRHWLGVDKIGRDVAAGMINGTMIALLIGCFSVFFSFIIGVFLGMAAGYFGDQGWKLNIIQISFGVITLSVSLFFIGYEFLVFSSAVFYFIASSLITITLVFGVNFFLLGKLNIHRFSIPLDLIIMKMIELRKSIPGLFLILSLVFVFDKPSVWNIILIVTLLGWTEFARFSRSETLGIRHEPYIQSAILMGFDHFTILRKHILPNILPILMVVICFNVSSAILLESSLSFLGIGLPVEEVTWGKLMSEGRNMRSWWLVVFPGLAIFSIILSLNIVASRLQEKLSK